MAQGACLMLAQTRRGSRSAVLLGGREQPRNQAAEEGYRVVRNGRISARNSAPGVGTSPQDAKKARRNLLSRRALRCRGDWIRTSDLLNPIQRGEAKKGQSSRGFQGIGGPMLPTVYAQSHRFLQFLLPLLPAAPGCGSRGAKEEVRRLRAEDHSLVEVAVAERSGTAAAKARRIVGKFDTAGRRQEGIARAIDAEPLNWGRRWPGGSSRPAVAGRPSGESCGGSKRRPERLGAAPRRRWTRRCVAARRRRRPGAGQADLSRRHVTG
jgi:hypothetical protein